MGQATGIVPDPGVYRDLPFGVYQSWDAINHSRLNVLFNQSPLHYYHNIPRERTRSTDLGDVAHALILTPAEFAETYVLQGQCSAMVNRGKSNERRCSKTGQVVAGGLQFCSTEGHAPDDIVPDETVIVTRSVWDAAHSMRDAVMGHAVAGPVIERSVKELSLSWRDQATGLPMKARVDIDAEGSSSLFDLKTSDTTGIRDYMRKAERLGYHRQLALYMEGLAAVGRQRDEALWIVAETSAPWDVAVMRLDRNSLGVSKAQNDDLRRIIVRCMDEDCWPGSDNGEPVVDVSLSDYALRSVA